MTTSGRLISQPVTSVKDIHTFLRDNLVLDLDHIKVKDETTRTEDWKRFKEMCNSTVCARLQTVSNLIWLVHNDVDIRSQGWVETDKLLRKQFGGGKDTGTGTITQNVRSDLQAGGKKTHCQAMYLVCSQLRDCIVDGASNGHRWPDIDRKDMEECKREARLVDKCCAPAPSSTSSSDCAPPAHTVKEVNKKEIAKSAERELKEVWWDVSLLATCVRSAASAANAEELPAISSSDSSRFDVA